MSLDETRIFWDKQASTFDDEPDHGLLDPATREAWAALLDRLLGEFGDGVVDLGCGTGSVSALLAQRGHQVFGVDVSPRMVEVAENKARLAGLDIEYSVGDVQTLAVPATGYGAVLSRHLLWAVKDPEDVVARWSAPLPEHGLFIAIEGVWNTAGTAPEIVFGALQAHFTNVAYTDLSDQSVLWGKDVTDHRYVIVGSHPRGDRRR